ncbi:hypothetical protein M8J76_001819 [Diaphorina citri]|nr:hypothetical protein M8J76_001819 [Diaphorina citri]
MSNKNIGGKKSQLCDQKKKLISEVFNVFDTDGDGQLNYLEFKSACKALGCPTKKVEILKTIKSYARTGVKNNCIEFSDFFDVLTDKLMKKDPEESLNEAFDLFAGEKDFIDFDTLKNIAGVIGEDVTDEELAVMIKEFDLNQDGKINREEFALIMKNNADII